MYSGLINVYKETGYTSHDVVAKLRGILKQKKIGHTGTLDPDAEGVLPVCLGKGTKLCDMLTDKDKTYRVTMLLGIETDTEDISGKIMSEKNVDVTEKEIETVVRNFIGKQLQVPPMYSALKVNGKKLYQYAREGVIIERQPRSINVYNIVINEINIPRVSMTIECSKGTYIRSLCRDMGVQLGCGACMEKLVRTKVSNFYIEDSLTLEQIENLVKSYDIDKKIVKVDEVFTDYEKVVVEHKFDKLIYNGNKFTSDCLKSNNIIQVNSKVRVYDEDDNFIGLYEKTANEFVPYKMFL